MAEVSSEGASSGDSASGDEEDAGVLLGEEGGGEEEVGDGEAARVGAGDGELTAEGEATVSEHAAQPSCISGKDDF